MDPRSRRGPLSPPESTGARLASGLCAWIGSGRDPAFPARLIPRRLFVVTWGFALTLAIGEMVVFGIRYRVRPKARLFYTAAASLLGAGVIYLLLVLALAVGPHVG